MLKSQQVEITIDTDQEEISVEDYIIYKINIINRHNEEVRDIKLDIYIPEELSFIKGEIQRERGMLDIQEGYTDLIIGNLAPEERAVIEFVALVKPCQTPRELLSYAIVKFSSFNQINMLKNEASVRVKVIMK